MNERFGSESEDARGLRVRALHCWPAGGAGARSPSRTARSSVMCPACVGVIGDAWRERGMQFAAGSSPPSRTPPGLPCAVRRPASKLSPRLNSFSKLPRMRPPALTFVSLFPYGPVTEIEGRDVAVDPRGPTGRSGSLLCFAFADGPRACGRSSTEDMLILVE